MSVVRQALQPYRNSLEHLLAGLNIVELQVQWAVVRARANGLDPDNKFRGLFVTDEQVDQLLNQKLGHKVWVNGHLPDTGQWEKMLAQARSEWRERTALGGHFALQTVIDEFALTPIETNALLIALAPEIDLRYERLFSYLQDDVTRKRPTVNLILNLLTTTLPQKMQLRALFEPDGRLNHWGLTTCYGEEGQSLLAQFVRPTERIVAHLMGHRGVDSASERYAHLHCAPFALEIADYFEADFSDYLHRTAQRNPLFALHGGYGVGKWAAARLIAQAVGRDIVRVDVAALKESEIGLHKGLKLVLRDARLNQAVLYLAGWDALLQDGRPPAAILQTVLAHPTLVITAGETQWRPVARQTKRQIVALSLPAPAYNERLRLWQRALHTESLAATVDLYTVASHFRFTPGQIIDAAHTAGDVADGAINQQNLLAACRFHSNQRLASLAVKINPRYGWSDIVLPRDTLAQLREAVAMVKQKPTVYDDWGFERKLALGKGMNALFVGDPGTGKTMAAEIIANELDLDLYKIDLSMMVSKYIGETEKNISKVFNEAATSNAILFFDEADAIFGKRSEVKDSHDRHANIEVSYLLQRMEMFDGVVILATNLLANIDEAFIRRLHFVIQFPFPERADRERIWRVTFPPETPLAADIDFGLLAQRFRLAGGNIRNIVLAAAFVAAEAGAPHVGMPHILHAARREHQKIGRLIKASLFEWR